MLSIRETEIDILATVQNLLRRCVDATAFLAPLSKLFSVVVNKLPRMALTKTFLLNAFDSRHLDEIHFDVRLLAWQDATRRIEAMTALDRPYVTAVLHNCFYTYELSDMSLSDNATLCMMALVTQVAALGQDPDTYKEPRVSLPALPPSELHRLIGYSYRGVLPLGWGRVFEVACVALRLQFCSALALCLDFMRREMTARSCLDVASFARAYGEAGLLAEADDFVLRNFLDVSSVPAFPDLPAEHLLAYLSSEALAVPTELCAFRAAASWVQADPRHRLAVAAALMREIRFPLMTFREFREVRAVTLRWECSGTRGGGEGGCAGAGEGGGAPELELYGSALAEFGADLPQTRRRVRRPKDALVLVGGDMLSWDTGAPNDTMKSAYRYALS
ncbi:hypothetical protein CRUP_028587 [Coryphaenoides rupestris]|nr:hypothetical protein CRUP_028587 [Coryphaenoides rupestris]